jgi:hypothetical protein
VKTKEKPKNHTQTGANPLKKKKNSPEQDPRLARLRPWVSVAGQDQSAAPASWVYRPTSSSFFYLFFSYFSSFSSFHFLPSLDENQLWEGLYFFCAIFLLYVRYRCPNGCYKTYLLQTNHIAGFHI